MSEAPKIQQLIALANRGLVAFRRGEETVGRSYYARAIEGFRADGTLEMAARAKIYLAREAMLARTSDWLELLKDAKSAMGKFKDSEAIQSLSLVIKMASEINQPTIEPQLQGATGQASGALTNVRVTFDMKPLPIDPLSD